MSHSVHLRPTVGVKAVIIRNNQLLAIVKRYSDGLAFILPGGKQEHGEPLDQAIIRECREEIGVDVTVHRLLFVREYIGKNHQYHTLDSDIHIVDIMFACHVPDDYTPGVGTLPDDEQQGVTWLSIASLDTVRFFPAGLKQALQQLEMHRIYIGDMN